jgi:hypothetical protein
MFDKTLIKTRNRFFWPFMRIQIQDFIASCEPCQLATHPQRIPKAKLTPIQTKVKRSLELVTTDFVGPLKRSKAGNINIVVICDQKTKYAWFRATRNQEAIVLAPILVKIQMEFSGFLNKS